jgi:hypothetical protein
VNADGSIAAPDPLLDCSAKAAFISSTTADRAWRTGSFWSTGFKPPTASLSPARSPVLNASRIFGDLSLDILTRTRKGAEAIDVRVYA